jgi:hypothetical protein
MYDPTFNLVDNPIDRYAIGNRTHDLKKDPDGGLTLYLQSDSPGKDKESNWLPSTKSGSYFLLLRTYLPGPRHRRAEMGSARRDPSLMISLGVKRGPRHCWHGIAISLIFRPVSKAPDVTESKEAES